MRQAVIDHIDALTLGTFKMSDELPFDASGQPLYQKNFKRIYVDNDQKTTTSLFTVLNGDNPLVETTTVRVYFTTDAKQLPKNYDSLVEDIKIAKDTAALTGLIERQCDVATSFTEDAMLTEFEFRFTKLT